MNLEPAVRANEQTLGLVRRTTGPANPKTIHFDYTYDYKDQGCREELDEYIRIGELIRSDAGYKDSPIGCLEKFLTGGRSAVEEYLGHDCFLDDYDGLEHAFYAIAAPCYAGKTQSAFVFGTVKPLYFVMHTDWYCECDCVQYIDKNFDSLSIKLAELSKMDIAHLKRLKNVTQAKGLDQYISVNRLMGEFKDEKFYALGFLKALILDAKNYRDDMNMPWIKYYVTTNRRLKIVPTSINQFLKLDRGLISQFCLFLDEFMILKSNILILNLARAAMIKVVVSNSNAKITNLACVRPKPKISRIDPMAWSVVFTRLNMLNWNLFTQLFPDIEDLISYFSDRVKPNERPYLAEFFENFKTVQVEKVRPGFLHLIIEAMREFKHEIADRPFSFNEFLCEIVHHLRTQLSACKGSLGSLYGRLATFALFHSNAYGPSTERSKDVLFHRKVYLRNHLYYLINPIDPAKFCFLTYPPRIGTRRPLKLIMDDSVEMWKPERTIFEQDEVLPFLAFMGLWHKQSISNLLEAANVYAKDNKPPCIDKVTMNVNLLEVFSAVSIINASHRDMNSSEITLTGQSGESFLTNFIKNLFSADQCRNNDIFEIRFPNEGVIGTIINRIHVPFLFPANLPIPAMFSSELSSCEEFHFRSVHFGTITSNKDRDGINCQFDFFLKDTLSASGIPSRGICTVECKKWQDDDVSLNELKESFDKAQAQHSALHIVICDSVVSKLKRNTRSFKDFKKECIDRKWQVLRLVQGELLEEMEPDQKVFTIERFHPDIYLPDSRSDYSMTCIIIELDVLNA